MPPAIAHLFKARREALPGTGKRGVSSFQGDIGLAESMFDAANKSYIDSVSVIDVSGHDSTTFVPSTLGKVRCSAMQCGAARCSAMSALATTC